MAKFKMPVQALVQGPASEPPLPGSLVIGTAARRSAARGHWADRCRTPREAGGHNSTFRSKRHEAGRLTVTAERHRHEDPSRPTWELLGFELAASELSAGAASCLAQRHVAASSLRPHRPRACHSGCSGTWRREWRIGRPTLQMPPARLSFVGLEFCPVRT
jgi:hypothetical protein